MVEHAAGRANDDLATARQFFDLATNRLAAVDGHRVDLAAVSELHHLFAHLHGQLARRHENERLWAVTFFRVMQPLDHRNDERGSFAGTGASLAHQIDAFERSGNEPGLNLRRFEIAGLLQSGQHGLGQVKRVKTGGGTGRGGDVFRRAFPNTTSNKHTNLRRAAAHPQP